MDPMEHDPVDSDHEDHESSSSLVPHGEGAKRGRYSYSKCTTCRQKKKKCEPPNRVWPSKCNRCLGLNLDCSPPENIRERTASLILSSRVDNGKIVKFPKPSRTATTSSSGSPTSASRPSPENLAPTQGLEPYANTSIPVFLCEQCEPLNISPARFLIPDRSRRGSAKFVRASGQPFSPRVSTRGIPGPVTSPVDHSGTAPGAATKPSTAQHACRISLGTLRTIRSNRDRCIFCYLVWWSAADQLMLLGEDAGRLDQCDPDTLSTSATWEIDGRKLIPSIDNRFYQPVTRHIRLSWNTFNSGLFLNDAYVVLYGENPGAVGLDKAFLGRRVLEGEGQELDYRTMKGWVRHCDVHHGSCRSHALLEAVPLRSGQDLRVVDVETLKLQVVPITEDLEYVVLSYTWTHPEPLLSKDRLATWQDIGIPESKLPRDVRSAVQVVQKLEKRYLWVDSLCIMHDDEHDKDRHYASMDRIFANASLTLCLARSSRPAQPLRQRIVSCGEKASLMLHHPLETYIRDSPWSKGVWTCQDRLLSGRCLILTDTGRAWFQCQEESMSQDIFESSYQGYSTDMVQNPAQIWNELSSRSSNYRAYIKGVELYTSRQLPQPDHALRAFEGISNFLSAHYHTRFFRGLPSVYLDMALLWTSSTSETERRMTGGRPVGPSWSWASWTGKATYRAPILTGAVEKIWDWLREHTWITWYLADYQGRLGQIGTYAVGELADRAEGREPTPKRMDEGREAEQPKRKIKWPSRNQTLFFKTVTEPARDPDRMDDMDDGTASCLPPPYFLQFWTWSAFFQLSTALPDSMDGQVPPPHGQVPLLRRFNILDCNGDICGSIVLPNDTAERIEQDERQGLKACTFELVALSDAKYFRKEEMPEWTYYVAKERDDSFWDLWYVLLVEQGEMENVSRRVGLGKVFKDAFHQSFQPGMEWREFILS